MALTLSGIESQIGTLFDSIEANITKTVSDATLPMLVDVGDLPLPAGALDPFAALKARVLDAIKGATGSNVAGSVADAITALDVAGLSAKADGGGGLSLTFAPVDVVAKAAAPAIDVSAAGLLDLKADAAVTIDAKLDATVASDSTGAFTVAAGNGPQISVDVAATLALNQAQANIGVATITASDDAGTTPGIDADYGFDLATDGKAITATPTLTAKAGLDLDFETSDVLAGILPDIKGELTVDFPTDGTTFGTPTLSLGNLKLELGSYLGILGSSLSKIAKLDAPGPVGTVVKIAEAPVPVLDDLERQFHLGFDTLGSITGRPDGKVTLGDLAAAADTSLTPAITDFFIAADVIQNTARLARPTTPARSASAAAPPLAAP